MTTSQPFEPITTGAGVRELRHRLGLTQVELSAAMGMFVDPVGGKCAVRHWERTGGVPPTPAILLGLIARSSTVRRLLGIRDKPGAGRATKPGRVSRRAPTRTRKGQEGHT